MEAKVRNRLEKGWKMAGILQGVHEVPWVQRLEIGRKKVVGNNLCTLEPKAPPRKNNVILERKQCYFGETIVCMNEQCTLEPKAPSGKTNMILEKNTAYE